MTRETARGRIVDAAWTVASALIFLHGFLALGFIGDSIGLTLLLTISTVSLWVAAERINRRIRQIYGGGLRSYDRIWDELRPRCVAEAVTVAEWDSRVALLYAGLFYAFIISFGVSAATWVFLP